MRRVYVIVFCVACAAYANTITAGLVMDDTPAIMYNGDLRPDAPLLDFFFHDYWGKPLDDKMSHKSYRPLVALTFRCADMHLLDLQAPVFQCRFSS